MLKQFFAASFVALSLLQTSCATRPPDVPVCAEITPVRGSCVYTMSGRQVEINDRVTLGGKTWWEIRPAMLQMPASSWAAIKAWIIKTCKTTNQCGKAVTNWERTIEEVDANVRSRLP